MHAMCLKICGAACTLYYLLNQQNMCLCNGSNTNTYTPYIIYAYIYAHILRYFNSVGPFMSANPLHIHLTNILQGWACLKFGPFQNEPRNYIDLWLESNHVIFGCRFLDTPMETLSLLCACRTSFNFSFPLWACPTGWYDICPTCHHGSLIETA